MQDLKGKVILITGASTGIGAAAARAFGAAGARVALNYRSRKADADEVVAAIAAAGGEARAFPADLTISAEVDQMVHDVHAHFGRIDVLINNAGGMVRRSLVADIDDAFIDEVFRLNARSVIAVSRRVIPLMAAQGGSIINVTSQAARTGGGPGASMYAGCKGFVSTVTRTMAKELVPQKIRVNAVAPGVIETPFHEGISTPEMLQTFTAGIPMGRLGTADECAGAFLFLASETASGYVTGQVLEVNGGQIMP